MIRKQSTYWKALKSTEWVDSFRHSSLFFDNPFSGGVAHGQVLSCPSLASLPLTRVVDEAHTRVYTFYSALLDAPSVEDEDPNRFKPEYVIYNAHNKVDEVPRINLEALMIKDKWVILSAHGGYFAAGVFEAGVVVAHKTMHAYVVRKKAGKRQSTKDKTGKRAKSIGSAMRRANEVKHAAAIKALIGEWNEHFLSADRIFVNLPGPTNKKVLFFDGSPVASSDPRVRQIPFSTGRPKWKLIQEIYEELTTVEAIFLTGPKDNEAIEALFQPDLQKRP